MADSKFIQIAVAPGDQLYALDELGQVWVLQSPYLKDPWKKVVAKREE